MLAKRGRLDEAQSKYERARELLGAILPVSHPYIANLDNNLGYLKFRRGLYREALPLIYSSIPRLASAWGNENPHTKQAVLNFVRCVEELKKQNVAVVFQEEFENGEYKKKIDSKTTDVVVLVSVPDKTEAGESQNDIDRGIQLYEAGNSSMADKRFSEAVSQYTEANEIFRKLGDKKRCGMCLNNLGNTYFRQRQLQKASDCYRESAVLFLEIKEFGELAKALNNQGNVFLMLGQTDAAIALYKQKQQICENLGDEAGVAAALKNQESATALREKLDSEED